MSLSFIDLVKSCSNINGYNPFPPRTVTPVHPTTERGRKGEESESEREHERQKGQSYCFIFFEVRYTLLDIT